MARSSAGSGCRSVSCNLDRLLADVEARALDGLVTTTPLDVFYPTSFPSTGD